MLPDRSLDLQFFGMSVIVSTNEFGRVMLQKISKHNSMYSMIDAKYKKQGRTPIVMLTRQWHTSILSRILNYNSINLSVACSKMLGHIYNHPKAVNFDRDSRTEWCYCLHSAVYAADRAADLTLQYLRYALTISFLLFLSVPAERRRQIYRS